MPKLSTPRKGVLNVGLQHKHSQVGWINNSLELLILALDGKPNLDWLDLLPNHDRQGVSKALLSRGLIIKLALMRLWRTVQVTIVTLTTTHNGPSDKVKLTVTRVIRATIHFLVDYMWGLNG